MNFEAGGNVRDYLTALILGVGSSTLSILLLHVGGIHSEMGLFAVLVALPGFAVFAPLGVSGAFGVFLVVAGVNAFFYFIVIKAIRFLREK